MATEKIDMLLRHYLNNKDTLIKNFKELEAPTEKDEQQLKQDLDRITENYLQDKYKNEEVPEEEVQQLLEDLKQDFDRATNKTEKLDQRHYLNDIETRIKKFNDLEAPTPEDNQQLTQDLYQLTEEYLKKGFAGADNFKVLTLLRHGECTDWNKGGGFNPNTNISPRSDKNMGHFDFSALVHNKQDPAHVVFSTMTRAINTAKHLIKSLNEDLYKKLEGKPKPTAESSRECTEIAEGVSGYGIESAWDYLKLIFNPKADVKPTHRAMLVVSLIFGFGITLIGNMKSKTDALKSIGENSNLKEDELNHSSDVANTKNYEKENGVAKKIVDEIDKGNTRDMFIVGHGNSIRDTLTTFFPNYKKHREKDKLDFGESQSLMAFDVNGEKQLFMLPFRIQVDQKEPGKMNVRYVDYAELTPDYQKVAEDVNKKQEDIDAQKAAELGSPKVSKELDSPKGSVTNELEAPIIPPGGSHGVMNNMGITLQSQNTKKSIEQPVVTTSAENTTLETPPEVTNAERETQKMELRSR